MAPEIGPKSFGTFEKQAPARHGLRLENETIEGTTPLTTTEAIIPRGPVKLNV